MHRKSGRQIGQAIETCLDLFYLTGRPQAALTRTLAMLRQLGWREGDLVRVERVARKGFDLPPSTLPPSTLPPSTLPPSTLPPSTPRQQKAA
jgi:hypothetical protein